MIKYIPFVLLVIGSPRFAIGQSAYFKTDSTSYLGVTLIDAGDINNSQVCQVKSGDKIKRYSPYEVKEYGLKDGRVYLSSEVQISDSSRRVFLEYLYKGNCSLFYYAEVGYKTFFIEKESNILLEMPKQNENDQSYREQLSIITNDCPHVADATQIVNYNKKSLYRLIDRYNKCDLKPFPHFRFGFSIGYELIKLEPLPNTEFEYINYFDFDYDGGFAIGFFVDVPIDVSDISLHSEIIFTNHVYSYNKYIDNEDLDFLCNLSSLRFPFLIRYAIPTNKIRPFLNFGPIGSYHIRNETKIHHSTIRQNIIELDDPKVYAAIDNIQLGYCIGGGIEYKLNFKTSLFTEIRFNKQYGITNPKSVHLSVIELVTGINF